MRSATTFRRNIAAATTELRAPPTGLRRGRTAENRTRRSMARYIPDGVAARPACSSWISLHATRRSVAHPRHHLPIVNLRVWRPLDAQDTDQSALHSRQCVIDNGV